jgi:hypothetical protein
VQQVGSFLAFLALMVLPANLLVGNLSEKYEDRTIIVTSEVITILGLLIILSYWDE